MFFFIKILKKYEKISEKKLSTTPEVLCKGFPEEFQKYLTYTKNLKFDDAPDYDYLRKELFRKLYTKKLHYQYDFLFDWNIASRTEDRSEEQRTSKISHSTQQITLKHGHVVNW